MSTMSTMSTMRNDIIWNLENEWREINFLFERLLKYGILKSETKKTIRPFCIHEKQGIINDLTKSLSINDEYKHDKINEINRKLCIGIPVYTTISPTETKQYLLGYFIKQCVCEDSISWIKESNNDLIEYLWGYINIAKLPHGEKFLKLPKFYKIGNNETKEITQERMITDENQRKEKYKELKLNLQTEKYLSKHQLIILFFDLLDGDAEIKKQQIIHIQEKWRMLEKNNKMRNWIEQNDDIIEWSFRYIKNNFLSNRLPFWITNPDNHDESQRENKIKLALLTIYNLIEPDEVRQLLLNVISRAGAQKRYKTKTKTNRKTNINIVISNVDKEKFDKIKSDNHLNSEEMLSKLINDYIDPTINKPPIKIF